jgi:hypothetical protein
VPGGSFALNVGGKSVTSKATEKGENAPEDLTFNYILP